MKTLIRNYDQKNWYVVPHGSTYEEWKNTKTTLIIAVFIRLLTGATCIYKYSVDILMILQY